MNVKKIQFLLLALTLHATAACLFSGSAPVVEGKLDGLGDLQRSSKVLHVALHRQEKYRMPSLPETSSSNESAAAWESATETPPEPLINTQRAAVVAAQEPTLDPNLETSTEIPTLPEYLDTGRLTRLPAPATEVDLNIAELQAMSLTGFVKLTILIEANGTVSHVLSSAENDDLRDFAQQVAEIFKRARFIPGEVNGKPVRSQLDITVVSEESATL